MTVSPEKIAEMLAAAEKATPGPWENDDPRIFYAEDAAFVTLCKPTTITSILTELTTLRQLSGITEETSSGRDLYECANQLEGYVGPSTPVDLAAFLMREGAEAAKLADEIVRLRSLNARQGEVLKPLVALANEVFRSDGGHEMNSGKRDDQAIWGFDNATLTYGDLRRARAALATESSNG